MVRPSPLLALALVSALAGRAGAAPAVVDDHFKVDQFGWRPGDEKVAVISEPVAGWNAPSPYTPGATIEVRRWDDDTVAHVAAPAAWRGGAVHAQSGDRAWRVDFTALAEPGAYYLHDPAADRSSGRFEIDEHVHAHVLDHAVRSFYYQRCGVAKDAAHAGAIWADGSCHVTGPESDVDARSVSDTSARTSRDLSDGWHDAGDYNKYVNYADNALHDLLAAFEENPAAFGDDLDIPESGNGRPDLLDEIAFELEWLLKMQLPDGSVLHKIQATDFSADSPPSADGTRRRYAPATASATISACGAWAHAAIVFEGEADAASQDLAGRCRAAALAAWNWLEANPAEVGRIYGNAGFQGAASEDDGDWQRTNMTCAAVYLACLTGEARFRAHVDAHHDESHLLQWGFAYPFESELQDGLLYYARCAGATPSVVAAIRAAYLDSVGGNDNWAPILADDDAYRAFLEDGNYTWGSSRTKANKGLMFLQVVEHGLAPARDQAMIDAGSGYLRYLHGVNPNGLVFLSSMDDHGAERSCTQFYHSWWGEGTPWDDWTTSPFGPPPGFVPGGVNPQFRPDPSYAGPPLAPPLGQPVQKAYRDWNTSWPENSWEVTENAIGYQAGYVRLLAHFTSRPATLAIAGPAPVIECLGTPTVLEAAATGGTAPHVFEWLHDGMVVPGATGPTLDLGALALDDAGSYVVVVRDAAGEEARSAAADVVVRTVPAEIGTLFVTRPTAVTLTWVAPPDSSAFDVARCDGSAGRCTPATFLVSIVPSAVDPMATGSIVWYSVFASNDCGLGP